MSDEFLARFWFFGGVVYWPLAALILRWRMRKRVVEGSLSQRQVDRFAWCFGLVPGVACVLSGAACLLGGPPGHATLGILWALLCVAGLYWLWFRQLAETLLPFLPAMGIPLTSPRIVRLLGSALLAFGFVGNASHAISAVMRGSAA